ncbi:DUF2497 domain-containing protein [Reyranella aquatilis]|uniref:DUF2497 domain-containing protein n=1 Tax=Reyranella aquatilis TaxID=2035356 RepID=A0ABS8KNH9_9HYPH|nr:DUF2497 domain-containing protein [Reyranella aquatilis]MCC8427631.1 DUF2497 domain-containing protein [Reyranella aquatilis]
MSDGKGGPNNEPSMDDILASIRKIISDDEARAQGAGPRPPVVPPVIVPPAMTQPVRSASNEDVLLLTDIVEEPKSMSQAEPTPPRVEPVNPAEMPQPTIEPVASSPASPKVDTLVGAGVAGVASSAFARLNQAVQDSVPPPAATDPGPRVASSGQTIEDLVKEMLRPMLKDWLDTNLPPMVERYVEREIARLTRR